MNTAPTRGVIKESYYADIVVFDSETINDTATYDDPIQFPSGIEHVLVNGEFVVKDNNSTGAVPGRAIP